MRIGIFGGTFNPVHNGHKNLALEMKDRAKLDKIIIMPTYTPPHKEGKDLASGEHRIKMCQMMFTEDFFFVSDLEIKRQGKSYTYETLFELKKIYPDDELFLIIGSDMLLSFDKWYRYEEILSMVTLCVATRLDTVTFETLSDYAKNVLNLDSAKEQIIIADIEPYECSSTDVREQISLGLDASFMTSREIFDYARINLLYESPYMEYKRILRGYLDDHRFLHSLNVAESAMMLALEYGEDKDRAYFAGLVHDIMKNTSPEKQLQIMENSGIILSQVEKNNRAVWHAMAGAAFLKCELGIDDEEILSSVRYHTTGKAGMSTFEKIIYVADYISAERNYPDVDTMRYLAIGKNLDAACLYSLQYTLKSLSERKSVIHEDSLNFYNELVMMKH